MQIYTNHTFHIPVMGLCFTIDTPVKVARFGITSVVSIIEDHLIEKMREYYYNSIGEKYSEISTNEDDYRTRRITDYLNLIKKIVDKQIEVLRTLPFEEGSEIVKYFEMLPDTSVLKLEYLEMCQSNDFTHKAKLQNYLRNKITAGNIDVNIMSKLDKNNYSKEGEELPLGFSDALSALRGYAESNLNSAMIFSAGYNPRLYAYIEKFKDFFPIESGHINKRITLKVSDYRSALIQGKILAKKGIWVSEFRIESGLNCGGHAFPTEGFLLGPILEEFKIKRVELQTELLNICITAWQEKNMKVDVNNLPFNITAQGGIGTSNEDEFLREHYQLSSIGWGSPFLMVPEATNVDEDTLQKLQDAKKEDYHLSYASPLGIPFNILKTSSSEKQRLERIASGRPGSPCYKKFLATETEFTNTPICSASREYQNLKIKQLDEKNLDSTEYQLQYDKIVEKDCLCEGLGAAVLLKNNLTLSHKLSAVAICPGPNLAYFSKVVSLKEMVGHIYGKVNILNTNERSSVFINELNIYLDYFKKEISSSTTFNAQAKYLEKFKLNLLKGIDYYKGLIPMIKNETEQYLAIMKNELDEIEKKLSEIIFREENPISI
ncbi:MAG: hypothetical protein IPM51_01745 [Sphingobacteriaceae bacterium]|nr:hypothetical protein [Sphingobacteriaceae bacterium]